MSGAGSAGDLDLPSTIGRYRILARLAHDEIGESFKGFDPLIERPVVVKVFRQPSADPAIAQSIARRFYDEMQRIGVLVHPGIVPLFDAGECPVGLFMASEYVDGGSLADFVLQRQETGFLEKPGFLDATMSLIAQLVEALEYAHELGVPHRNLKPTSVRVTADSLVKVGGFGIASVIDAMAVVAPDARRPTRYRAPERVRGETGDERADVFSLAAVILDLLVGRERSADEPPTDVPQPSEPLRARGVQADRWGVLFARALAADPARRFNTIRGFFEELIAVLGVDRPDVRPVWEVFGLRGAAAADADSGDTETAISQGFDGGVRTTGMGGATPRLSERETFAADAHGHGDDDDPGATITKM